MSCPLRLTAFVLLSLLLAGNELAAKDCRLTITGSVKSGLSSPNFAIRTKERLQEPCHKGPFKDALCKSLVSCDTKEAVLKIWATNFKEYTRNLVGLSFKDGEAHFDIGEVKLLRSELPRVVQIIRSQAEDGSLRFEVFLHNPRKREVFIRELSFTYSRDARIYTPGFGPEPRKIFKLNAEIKLSSRGGRSRVSGTFQDLEGEAGYAYNVEGNLYMKPRGVSLGLRLPVGFTIPTDEYSVLELRLPRKFNITSDDSKLTWEEVVLRSLLSGGTSRFYSYTFTLFTSVDDEPPIEGKY